MLKLGIKVNPLSCLLNFLRCSIHGEHPQPSLTFSTNFQCHRHSLIEEIVSDNPPGRAVKTEIVNGTSTNARKVMRKYAAMTPASSYSYVAIVAGVLLFRESGGYPFFWYKCVRYSADDVQDLDSKIEMM